MAIHDKPAKPWTRMNADELARATKGAEALGFDDTTPLSPEQAVAWDRVKRGRGRPKVGEGAEKVFISMEKRLLRVTDELARRMGLDRSKLIARAVRELLTREAAGGRSGANGPSVAGRKVIAASDDGGGVIEDEGAGSAAVVTAADGGASPAGRPRGSKAGTATGRRRREPVRPKA